MRTGYRKIFACCLPRTGHVLPTWMQTWATSLVLKCPSHPHSRVKIIQICSSKATCSQASPHLHFLITFIHTFCQRSVPTIEAGNFLERDEWTEGYNGTKNAGGCEDIPSASWMLEVSKTRGNGLDARLAINPRGPKSLLLLNYSVLEVVMPR